MQPSTFGAAVVLSEQSGCSRPARRHQPGHDDPRVTPDRQTEAPPARREWWRVAGLVSLAAVAGVCGCTGAPSWAAGRGDVSAEATLARCASAWNRAPLGTGRSWVRAVAAEGSRALMVRFADGVCGLAFPASQVNKAGALGGVFVHVLRGDYFWGIDPVNQTRSASASSPSAVNTVESLAASESNVRVELRSGRAVPLHGHSIAVVGVPALSTTPGACQTLPDPLAGQETPPYYRVIKTTIACEQAAEIVWAYNQQQGRLLPPARAGIRSILGWRCRGRPAGGTPNRSGRVTCTRGTQRIDVQAKLLSLAPPSQLAPKQP